MRKIQLFYFNKIIERIKKIYGKEGGGGGLIYGRRWSRACIEHQGRASERYSALPAAVRARGQPVYAGVRWAAGSIRGARGTVGRSESPDIDRTAQNQITSTRRVRAARYSVQARR